LYSPEDVQSIYGGLLKHVEGVSSAADYQAIGG
jgi:hypothetical protein